MKRAPYRTLRGAGEQVNALAQMRRKRLNKQHNNWCQAVTLDLLWGAGPWLIGTCAVATGIWAIHEHVDGAPSTFAQFSSPVAITAISTFSAFLLVSKIQENLACNSTIVTEFGKLTGALINLALYVKSQMVGDKRAVQMLELPDGSGNTYLTNRIGMTLASVPYVVKYEGRGVDVVPEGLPLGQDPALVDRFKEYTSKGKMGSAGSMTPFTALVLIIGEQIDQIQRGEAKDSEYAVLFAQLNAVTAADGTIRAATSYSPPYVLSGLLYALVILYLLLALVGDLIPTNGANAIWIVTVMAFCTIVFYQISDRYWNPMALHSQRSGQKPLISHMCVATELAITAIFSRASPSSVPVEGDADAARASTGLRFSFL